MRAVIVAFVSGAALAAVSAQAAPRTRLASDPLARSMGLLAMG
jgi:hypothetical protein